MNRPYYQTPKAGTIMRTLWKCAGADHYLLERSTYSDQIKYMCMGGVVLATGIMAALAGGYAFYTIFEPKGIVFENYVRDTYGTGFLNGVDTNGKTISQLVEVTHWPTALKATIFGLIWGLIIFNLDRFIVSSTGKGDGTEAITWDELKGALPRIFMGIIIAITISKPLEIRMFKSEIDMALYELQEEEREALVKTKTAELDKRNSEVQLQIATMKKEIHDKEDHYNQLEQTYSEEATGQRGARGVGPEAAAIKTQMDRTDGEIKDLHSQYDAVLVRLQAELDSSAVKREKIVEEARIKASALDGLLQRIKLAHQEAGWGISLFITLLFMAIELTPIFFKLMLIQGPYDYMTDNVKELIKAENGIEVKYDYYKDKQGQERHLVVYHKPAAEIYEKVKWAESQKEITDKAISKWKEDQLKKVDENLNDFITEE